MAHTIYFQGISVLMWERNKAKQSYGKEKKTDTVADYVFKNSISGLRQRRKTCPQKKNFLVFQQIGYAARSKQFLIRPNFYYPFNPKLPSVVLRLNMFYNNPVFNGIIREITDPFPRIQSCWDNWIIQKSAAHVMQSKSISALIQKKNRKIKKKGTTEKDCLTPLGSLLEKKNRSIKEFLIWSFNTSLCSKRQTVFNTPILVTLYL